MIKRVTLALVCAGGLSAAAPASAGIGWTVQGISGTACTTDRRTSAPFEYRGRRLVNMGTEPLELVVAVCPINLMAIGFEPREYRVQLNDSQHRDTWCQVYGYDGTRVRTHFGQGGTWSFSGTLVFPLSWSPGIIETSIHCLLHPGASLERIEVLWYQP